MVNCSKILLNIWLFIFLVMSAPFTIVAWIYYKRRGFLSSGKTCFVNNVWIILAYGFCLIFLSIIGMIGSLCRIKLLQNIFNWIVNIVIIISLCITLFYLLALPRIPPFYAWQNVYNKTVPWTVMYPPLLRSTLVNDGKWSGVEHCLNEIQLCDAAHKHVNLSHVPETSRVYSLLITGCCYPPTRCGFVNDTSNEYHFEAPKAGLPANDTECERWSKINDGKCYDCDMCKASYLAKFHGDWKGVTYFHLFFMFFILIVSVFTGCGAFSELEHDRG